MPAVQIEAPAKLNMCLLVGDRRPDGFHGIESLFLALPFGDTLRFETVPASQTPAGQAEADEIHMKWEETPRDGDDYGLNNNFTSFNDLQLWKKIPSPQENIILRAVSMYKNRTGYNRRLKITVEKRIPLGGGLGGGSSDAAATLLALNRLASIEDEFFSNDTVLAGIGAELGSDVSFFLGQESAAAWVSGRGEIVTPVTMPQSFFGLSLVLVNPGFHSDTAGAYRLLDEYRLTHPSRHPQNEILLRSFAGPACEWRLHNDFLSVFLASGKDGAVYQTILDSLRDLGADCAGLSGSGSTCFGVFSSPEESAQAGMALSECWPFVKNIFPLDKQAGLRYTY